MDKLEENVTAVKAFVGESSFHGALSVSLTFVLILSDGTDTISFRLAA